MKPHESIVGLFIWARHSGISLTTPSIVRRKGNSSNDVPGTARTTPHRPEWAGRRDFGTATAFPHHLPPACHLGPLSRVICRRPPSPNPESRSRHTARNGHFVASSVGVRKKFGADNCTRPEKRSGIRLGHIGAARGDTRGSSYESSRTGGQIRLAVSKGSSPGAWCRSRLRLA